jgi:CRISPR-associated protein Csn2
MIEYRSNVDISLSVSEDLDVISLLKLFDVKIETNYNSLIEKLINYINILCSIKKIDILFLVNIKSYLSEENINELYKHCFYNKINLFLLESSLNYSLPCEKTVLIDKDLCEIMVNGNIK